MKPNRYYLIPLFSAAFLLICGLVLFPAPGRDDAYITYWASYSFARFGQVLNYNFTRVEQSSSLAQVVLVGLISRLFNLDVTFFGRLSTIFFGVLTVIGTFYLPVKFNQDKLQVAALLLATNPFFIYWSFGGLETTLAAFGWLVFVFLQTNFLEKNQSVWLLISGLLVLFTRPENPLIVLLFSMAVIFLSVIQYFWIGSENAVARQGLFRSIKLFLLNLLMAVGVFALRAAMFGDIFPQPVWAKTQGVSTIAVKQGLRYLQENFGDLSMVGIGLACLAGTLILIYLFLWKKHYQPLFLQIVILLSVYLLFIALTGGDWMEGGRFIVNIIPLMMLLAAFALSRISNKPVRYVAVLAIICLQMAGLIQLATLHSTAIPAWKTENPVPIQTAGYSWFEKHNVMALRDIPTIAALDNVIQKTLAYKKGPVVIMSGQMGMVAYYTAKKYGTQIIWLDRNGLTDRSFTSCSLSNEWKRNARGHLSFSYKTFIRNLPDLQEICDIPTPDIIFDTGGYIGTVSDYDFEIVYSQTGKLPAGIGANDEYLFDVGQFIAIHQSETGLLKEFKLVKYDISLP